MVQTWPHFLRQCLSVSVTLWCTLPLTLSTHSPFFHQPVCFSLLCSSCAEKAISSAPFSFCLVWLIFEQIPHAFWVQACIFISAAFTQNVVVQNGPIAAFCPLFPVSDYVSGNLICIHNIRTAYVDDFHLVTALPWMSLTYLKPRLFVLV